MEKEIFHISYKNLQNKILDYNIRIVIFMDYEYLTDLQKIVLLLAVARNKEPIRGNTWLQKEVFLIAKNIDKVNKEASFEADFFGPFSENLEEEVDDLVLDDLLLKNSKIRISSEGEKVVGHIKKIFTDEQLELIDDMKEFLNDLSEEELLAFIYFSYPEMARESLVRKNIEKKRVELAISLYKRDKISIEKTSEISGLPIEKLIKEL